MGDFGAVVDGEFGDVGLGRGEAVIMAKICVHNPVADTRKLHLRIELSTHRPMQDSVSTYRLPFIRAAR
jgi:hypothetical protein